MFSTAFNAHPDSIRHRYLSFGLTNIKNINFTVLGYIPDVDLKTENVAKTFLKSLHNKNWIRSHCGFNFPHSTQILFPHCERISFSLFREAASAISLTDLWQKNVEILISVRTVFGQLTIFSLNPMLRNHVKSNVDCLIVSFSLKFSFLEYHHFTVTSKWYDCCNKMSQFFIRIIQSIVRKWNYFESAD